MYTIHFNCFVLQVFHHSDIPYDEHGEWEDESSDESYEPSLQLDNESIDQSSFDESLSDSLQKMSITADSSMHCPQTCKQSVLLALCHLNSRLKCVHYF